MTGYVGKLCARCGWPEHSAIQMCRGVDLPLDQQLAQQHQAGLRNLIKPSLLVTTGVVPTQIAAQTLVG